jgi:hypothetical protein
MTAPRRRPPNENSPPQRDDKESARPVIDNRGLTLEEGNDFA